MESPNNALWPCVIEKAYAKHLNKGGYTIFEKFSDAEQVWKDIAGVKPGRLELVKAKNEEIINVLMGSGKTPTIATTPDHGYVVRGKLSRAEDKDDIKLYDT
jgi:hypothetical protein